MLHRLLSLLFVLLCLSSALAEKRKLIILHTNDIHGHVEAYDKGGLTRVAVRIKEIRKENPGVVVLLDGGDTSLGTPLSGHYFGKPVADVMAYLVYDAVAIGNHEFNWGQKRMRSLTDAMKTDVLCANLVNTDGSPPPYPAFTIVERNGVKLAVVGMVTADTARRVQVEDLEGWEFLPIETALRNVLPTLPKDIDSLVMLNHIGVKADRELVNAVPEIDLIVGGHSHTPLQEVVYENETPIVQAGCYGQFLGVLEIEVDTDTDSLEVKDYHLEAFDHSMPVDPEAGKIVEAYAAELRPILAREVAHVTDVVSNKPAPDSYDTPLGNLISDVFRHQGKTDIALYNRGGVRFDMAKGSLKVEDVHKLFPFNDPVMVLEATGDQLRRVVEQGTFDGEGPLSGSGVTAVINDDRVGEITINGKPLQPKRLYTIATTKFLAGGGDGMATLSQLKVVRTLPFTRDVLFQYLEGVDTLQAPKPGRFKKLSPGKPSTDR